MKKLALLGVLATFVSGAFAGTLCQINSSTPKDPANYIKNLATVPIENEQMFLFKKDGSLIPNFQVDQLNSMDWKVISDAFVIVITPLSNGETNISFRHPHLSNSVYQLEEEFQTHGLATGDHPIYLNSPPKHASVGCITQP